MGMYNTVDNSNNTSLLILAEVSPYLYLTRYNPNKAIQYRVIRQITKMSMDRNPSGDMYFW